MLTVVPTVAAHGLRESGGRARRDSSSSGAPRRGRGRVPRPSVPRRQRHAIKREEFARSEEEPADRAYSSIGDALGAVANGDVEPWRPARMLSHGCAPQPQQRLQLQQQQQQQHHGSGHRADPGAEHPRVANSHSTSPTRCPIEICIAPSLSGDAGCIAVVGRGKRKGLGKNSLQQQTLSRVSEGISVG